jgi:hypothetical protein
MSPDEAMTPKQWKKDKKLKPVEMPSGNTGIIRRRPLQAFLKAGLIPNDLLPIIQEALKAGKTEIKPEEIMQDDKKVVGVLELIDVVVVACMVEPEVLPAPVKESERDEDLLYVDEIDWDDKQFIYTYAIGSVADLEAFREQQKANVEVVPDGDVADDAPIKSGRSKR